MRATRCHFPLERKLVVHLSYTIYPICYIYTYIYTIHISDICRYMYVSQLLFTNCNSQSKDTLCPFFVFDIVVCIVFLCRWLLCLHPLRPWFNLNEWVTVRGSTIMVHISYRVQFVFALVLSLTGSKPYLEHIAFFVPHFRSLTLVVTEIYAWQTLLLIYVLPLCIPARYCQWFWIITQQAHLLKILNKYCTFCTCFARCTTGNPSH